jgi:predicted transcriptional regulator
MADTARDEITLRLDPGRRAELDALAAATHRDLHALVTDAVEALLAAHRGEIARIREGLRQADAGEFATDEEVAAAYARWR